MLRDLGEITYAPLLGIKPAEMLALQSLPERDKDSLLPVFRLQRWVASNQLASSLGRISEAYGTRPFFLTLCEPELVDNPKDVHRALDALRSSADGFSEWCSFFENPEHSHCIPSLQLNDVSQFDLQAVRLQALGRGLLVHIEQEAFRFLRQIARRTAIATGGGEGVLFIIDFGKQSKTLLLQQAEAVTLCRHVLEAAPLARVSISASTFPDQFTAITRQDIYERQLFTGVRNELGRLMIYSDRGSARIEQRGGGGTPAPRVDFAQAQRWLFYRDASRLGFDGYQQQADRLMQDSEAWDPSLRLWGTQMIERTALGDSNAISSPARATAVRINLHLHQQLFYGDSDGLHSTDEEWTD